jgi:hypothetical protein
MPTPQTLPMLAQTAFNARDEAGLRALWTDDFHFIGPASEYHSAEKMLAQERALWAAFPDVRASVRLVAAGDDVAVLETIMTGTHTGPYRLGDQVLPPSGRPIELRISVHVQFRGDLACGERVYLDQLTLLQQMGMIPVAA